MVNVLGPYSNFFLQKFQSYTAKQPKETETNTFVVLIAYLHSNTPPLKADMTILLTNHILER